MNGQTLKRTRERLPLPFSKQRVFATLVGRSRTMLSKYENGRAVVPAEVAVIATICHVLIETRPIEAVRDLLVPAFDAAERAAR